MAEMVPPMCCFRGHDPLPSQGSHQGGTSGLGASRSCGWCGQVREYEARRNLDVWPTELAAGITFVLTDLWSTESAFRLAHAVRVAGSSSMPLLLEEEA